MLWPTMRTSRAGLVAVTILVGAAPVVIALALRSDDLLMPMVILATACGASTGWLADDPIIDLATPCPVNTPRRLACRIALSVTVSFLSAALILGFVVAASGPRVAWEDRLPETCAALAIALATGLSIRRRGDSLAGSSAVVAGMIGPPFVAGLAFRWPEQLPSFASSPVHDRWWTVAAGAALVAIHALRDPAHR